MDKKTEITNVNHAWSSAMKENGIKPLILLGDDYLTLLESNLASLTFGIRDFRGLTGQLLSITMTLEIGNDVYSLVKNLYLGKQNRMTNEHLITLTKAMFEKFKEEDISIEDHSDGTLAPLDTFVYRLFKPSNAKNYGLIKEVIRQSFNRVVEVHLSKEVSIPMYEKTDK